MSITQKEIDDAARVNADQVMNSLHNLSDEETDILEQAFRKDNNMTENQKDNIVLILAAGKGTRWRGERPKQLVDVDGETLIARTQRQVKGYGWTFRVVTATEDIKKASECWFEPSSFDWIVDTMLSTEKLWRRRTCFLFGDVLYSDDFIDQILSDDSPFQAYKNRSVIGITFDKSVAKIVEYALISTVEGTRKGFVDGLVWRFLGEFSKTWFITDTEKTVYPINTLADYEIWKVLER